MKNIYCLLLIICISCLNGNQNSDTLIFSGSTYIITLNLKKQQIEKFELKNIQNNESISGIPELIKIDGRVPEGTNRIDNNNPNDIRGIECDSSYQFISQKVKISFAVEKGTKKRVDLTIYGSNNKKIQNGDFTLVNQNVK